MAEEKKKDPDVLDDGAEGTFASFDDILSTQDTEYKTIKGWGGKPVRIGSLTAGQMITFLESNNSEETKKRNGRMLIVLSLVDKAGKRLVDASDQKAVDAAIDKLADKDARVNGKIVEHILEFNGMRTADAKTAAKNDSSGPQRDGSQ